MIQLKVLSGKKAGAIMAARHFPLHIGRRPDSDLCLDEQGVWEEHFSVAFDPLDGIMLKSHAEAVTIVNGHHLQGATLRNGDLIEIGSVRLQFWIGETTQRASRWREWLIWVTIVVISLTQIALVYWLPD